MNFARTRPILLGGMAAMLAFSLMSCQKKGSSIDLSTIESNQVALKIEGMT